MPRKTNCPWPTTDPVCPFDGKKEGTCASLKKVKHEIYIYICQQSDFCLRMYYNILFGLDFFCLSNFCRIWQDAERMYQSWGKESHYTKYLNEEILSKRDYTELRSKSFKVSLQLPTPDFLFKHFFATKKHGIWGRFVVMFTSLRSLLTKKNMSGWCYHWRLGRENRWKFCDQILSFWNATCFPLWTFLSLGGLWKNHLLRFEFHTYTVRYEIL